eukprot:4147559-Alexandrium_andersonii.AAC.1
MAILRSFLLRAMPPKRWPTSRSRLPTTVTTAWAWTPPVRSPATALGSGCCPGSGSGARNSCL